MFQRQKLEKEEGKTYNEAGVRNIIFLFIGAVFHPYTLFRFPTR